MDELERLERYAYIREANRALLEKHRQSRIQVSELAANFAVATLSTP